MFNEQIEFRTILKFVAIGVLVLFIGTYVLFQARFMIIGPQITLTDEPHQLQNQQKIYLSGTAYNISRLWLNDRPIYTDAHGNFKEALILENGYTVATLRAEDRYGRETTVTRPFVYYPASFIQ